MIHGETELEDPKDSNIVNTLTKTTTDFLTIGINFVLPVNIFWDKVFCLMATSKSYVFSDNHSSTVVIST